jgi:hypothetical protein
VNPLLTGSLHVAIVQTSEWPEPESMQPAIEQEVVLEKIAREVAP